jgi:transaldolase
MKLMNSNKEIIMETGLKVSVYADGADIDTILKLKTNRYIKGFTTNPTLMRKAGINDYESFSKELLNNVTDLPVSLEVFADDLDEMLRQAKIIASWGENVYVKIPVMNTLGISTGPIIKKLSEEGVALNITAIMTPNQVSEVMSNLSIKTPSIISVFAGRIADTGIDPIPQMKECLNRMKGHPKSKLLWASSRELLNIIQANDSGCHIITVGHDLLEKMKFIGYDLLEFSQETVKMFYDDAVASGYKI